MTEGEFLYAIIDETCIIKPMGSIVYSMSGDLDEFFKIISEEESIRKVLVDLTETTYLDSTNLGLLARMNHMINNNPGKENMLFFANKAINEIIIDLGLNTIFTIIPHHEYKAGQMVNIPHSGICQEDLSAIVLEAHKFLMTLNNENRDKFKNVVEYINQDMNSSGNAN